MRSAKWVPACVTVCACVMSAHAWASDKTNIPPPDSLGYGPESSVAYVASKVEGSPHVEGLGQSTADDQLADLSGGTNVQQNTTLTGTVSGNTAENVAAGSNAITGQAFSGAEGLPTVIQNTGSNVLIQNATVVNLQLTP